MRSVFSVVNAVAVLCQLKCPLANLALSGSTGAFDLRVLRVMAFAVAAMPTPTMTAPRVYTRGCFATP